MFVFPDTIDSPLSLEATHDLLIQWRQANPKTSHIPPILRLAIGSLTDRYPTKVIRKTLGLECAHLRNYKVAYQATKKSLQEPHHTTNSNSTPDPHKVSPVFTNDKLAFHSLETPVIPSMPISEQQQQQAFPETQQPEHQQTFIKIPYTPALSTVPFASSSDFVPLHLQESSLMPQLQSYQQTTITTEPTAPTTATVADPASVSIELKNSQDILFRVSLPYQQALLFLQTYMKSSS